jgi:hypothetical protein
MLDTTVAVIDRAIELAPAKIIDVQGFTHIDKDKNCTLFTPPVPKAIQVDTLSGFVGLLELGFEEFDPARCLVHVAAHNKVKLVASASDKYGQRQTWVVAESPAPEREFQFNTYIPQEEFNIALRTMFVQDDELDSLVQLCGNIAKQTEVRQEDDGFSQTVTAKSGSHLVKNETIKPRITLKPFRTFLEVEQPAGDYILRVQRSEQRGNLLALFQADAGRWKLTAMETVSTWLQQQIKTSAVEQIRNLPVIA